MIDNDKYLQLLIIRCYPLKIKIRRTLNKYEKKCNPFRNLPLIFRATEDARQIFE